MKMDGRRLNDSIWGNHGEAEEWLSRNAKANPAKYRYPFAA
jgi:hypothetical protein